MKILILGNINSNFVYEYLTEIVLSKEWSEIAIGTYQSNFDSINKERLEFCKKKKVNIILIGSNISRKQPLVACCKYVKRFCDFRFCHNYDVIQTIFVYCIEGIFTSLWTKKNAKVITSFAGSDLLRTRKLERFFLSILLKRSNYITLGSLNMIQSFKEFFGSQYDNVIKKIDFGAKNTEILFENIDKLTKEDCKRKLGFDEQKLTILCGYNGNRSQRHIEIVNALSLLNQETKKGIQLVFHCGYGANDDYLIEIRNAINHSDISITVLTDYLSGKSLAEFRKSIDIFLNLQPTDALSNTMLESLYSGTIVVNGEWLSYPDLDNIGAFYLSVTSIESLAERISDIYDNYKVYNENCRKNRNLCSSLMLWETYKEKWLSLL